MASVTFGIFDHVDRGDEPLGTLFEQRLRLAEARYQTGVGNAIELGDAQLGVTNAGVQKLQAEFQLGVARAQLLKALGQG